MNKFLAQTFVIALAVLLQVLVMTKGWGLTPQSWWWIIGGGFFGMTALTALNAKVAKAA